MKTRKTAGTSVEIALSGLCGPRDVITPVSPKDEKIRNMMGHLGPQNYEKTFGEYSFKDWARLLLKAKRAKRFYNHIPAWRVRDIVGDGVWSNYYTFCFDRHPFDKVISYFDWINRDEHLYESISDFIRDGRLPLLSNQGGWGLYTDRTGESVIVDDVYRYEDLDTAMKQIAKRLGLDEAPGLPRTKHKSRSHSRGAPERALSELDMERIRSVFRREIDYLGYEC